ncbi:MAG: hypothetical protein ABJM06_10005 [Gilvibacter sp.]
MKKALYIILFVTGNIWAQIPVNDSFSPEPGTYILSAWVKDKVIAQTHQYDGFVEVETEYSTTGGDETFSLTPTGPIIDGWQRIFGEFTINPGVEGLFIKLQAASVGTYFDDVRILPFNGSLKSFVYDPVNQRLMAELDENNYATIYEYDHEGGLIRVKKETARGVFTIQETRSKSSKVSNE